MSIRGDRRSSRSALHQLDALGPRIGVPKLATIGGLLAASAVWFMTSWREIRRTRRLTLLAALGALATSVALDIERREADFDVFFEDAAKLPAIMGWATYFVLTAADVTGSVLQSRDHASA